MARARMDQTEGWGVSALWYLVMLSAGGACLFLVLHALYQPTVYANPGLAAFHPPPGTRLLPVPGKHDAPILAALPDVVSPQGPEGSTALAEAKPSEPAAKPDTRAPKHPRVARNRYETPSNNNPYQWRSGNSPWQVASRPWF
jgi:hypothetical protein